MAVAAVRPAAVADVDEIVRVQADTWAAAYAQLVPPDALAQLGGSAARQAWVAAVSAGAGRHVLVATEGSRTVGFCAAEVAPADGRPAAAGAGAGGAGAGGADAAGAVRDGAPRAGAAGDGEEAAGAADVGLWAEIGVLLVEPRWGRRGHGGRLLAAAAAALGTSGARYGLAWVPETDEASRRFYARAGWEPDGGVRAFDTGDGTVREVRVTGSLDLQLRH